MRKYNLLAVLWINVLVMALACSQPRAEHGPQSGSALESAAMASPGDNNEVRDEKASSDLIQIATERISGPSRLAEQPLGEVRALDLRNANLTSLSQIEHFHRCEVLLLSNRMSVYPSNGAVLGRTPNSIGDLSPLRFLLRLQELDLHASLANSPDLEPISTLGSLRYLDISANAIDASKLDFSGLLLLEELNISGTKTTSLKFASTLPNLHTLNIEGIPASTAQDLLDAFAGRANSLRLRLYVGIPRGGIEADVVDRLAKQNVVFFPPYL